MSLVRDSDGYQYDPDSIAWRYLGVFVDCDIEDVARDFEPLYDTSTTGGERMYSYDDDQLQQQQQQQNQDDDIMDEITDWYRRDRRDRRRFLGGGGSQDQNAQRQRKCGRKLLWAAYHDPHYQGGQISEYSQYDFETGRYHGCSSSLSSSHHRCVRRDCHEPNTHFRLVGVYKESDGLMEWAEQLFEHHGSCLWHSDQDHVNLEVMQDSLETIWPSHCRRLYYSSDSDDSLLYMDIKPQPEGNITVGVYRDEQCVVPSEYSFEDYIVMYYDKYGSYETGVQIAATWKSTINTWNEYMREYKICQPCRSYSLNDYTNNNNENRALEEENDNNGNDDGNGNYYYYGDMSEEQSGYNCYDDAGTTNANQVSRHSSRLPQSFL